MAYNMRSVSRTNPCPICGKHDWCGWYPIAEGELLICHRDAERENKLGTDGAFYVFHGTSQRTGSSTFEEAMQRYQRTGSTETGTATTAPRVRYTEEEKVEICPPNRLDLVYRAMLNELILEEHHKQQLIKDGWSVELIKESGVKSFPVPDSIRYKEKITTRNPKRNEIAKKLHDIFGDLTGVPGMHIKEYKGRKYWSINGPTGMIFPLENLHHQVVRLRIRMDKEFNGKYRYLSSYKSILKGDTYANRFKNGSQALNMVSFYTHNCYSEADYYLIFLTEGCKKGFIGNRMLNAVIGNVPGVNSFGKILEKDHTGMRVIDILKKRGTKVIVIAYDADKDKNEAVMNFEKRTVEALKKEGFIIGLAEWPKYLGKGLDDILLKGHKPQYTIPDYTKN